MDFLSWTTSSVITPCQVTAQELRTYQAKNKEYANRMFPYTATSKSSQQSLTGPNNKHPILSEPQLIL